MRFIKMHGLGNDYVYVNGFVEAGVEGLDLPALARAISDRHRGVGSDGLIVALPPTAAGVAGGAVARMRMFNIDGSEGDMCGNGLRCLVKLVFDEGVCRERAMKIETGNGVLDVEVEVGMDGKAARVRVDMAPPTFLAGEVPLDPERLERVDEVTWKFPATEPAGVAGVEFVGVNTGNPHAVVFVEGVAALEAVDVAGLGRVMEHHAAFPRRANVHWAAVCGGGRVVVRHWERGSGVTQACGTGATAVVVAGVVTGRLGRAVTAVLPGGELEVAWEGAGRSAWMMGEAVEVFRGAWG
ncbi:MAG: diaminopimelate epimerase [Phycisphaeraceae bacterium]